MTDTGSKRRVIVAGFGPVGRAVAQMLENAGLDVTIVELNLQTIQTQKQLGKLTIYGDICDPHVQQQADMATADALILTIPDEEASLRACVMARKQAPAIFIAMRTNHVSNAMRATNAGADHVTIEEIVTAQSMQRAVMLKLVSDDNG